MPNISDKEKKVLLVIIFFLLVGGAVRIYPVVFDLNKSEADIIMMTQDGQPIPTADPLKTPDNQKKEAVRTISDITAHICGAVKKPGVYTLPPNSRVKDFIFAAGGEEEIADLETINLARIVRDGEQISVPKKNSSEPNSAPEVRNYSETQKKYNKDLENSGNSSTDSSITNKTDTTNSLTGKVDLNKATLEELVALPRIGPSMAQRIIDYRTQYGSFNNIEELKNVKGIGEKTFNKIKDYLIVR